MLTLDALCTIGTSEETLLTASNNKSSSDIVSSRKSIFSNSISVTI
jgi:hypothetical protein